MIVHKIPEEIQTYSIDYPTEISIGLCETYLGGFQ